MSVANGGTPGAGDTPLFSGNPNADLDHDGFSAFAEYALGTSDTVTTTAPLTAALTGTTLDASFRRRIAADDAIVTAEFSTDRATWQPGTVVAETPLADGTAITIARTTLPPGTPRAFARLRITPRL